MSLSNRGFTLIELLVALAISGVIMTGVYSAFKSQQDSYLAQDQVAEIQQNIRAGLYIMARDIRMAGYDSANAGRYGIISATGTRFEFTADLNDDGGVPGSGETLRYELYTPTGATNPSLRRIEAQPAIAENIEQIEFNYILSNGTQTTAPIAAQLANIRSVQISILAVTGNADRNYVNTKTYTTGANVVWDPPDDNFRRRFQTMTIKCRNLGL